MAQRAARATATTRKRGPKAASPKLQALIADYRKQLAIARSCYERADRLLTELRTKLGVGQRVAIGGGLYAAVADVFADGDLIWKHQAVRRYDLRITDADGKEARLRDRKRKP